MRLQYSRVVAKTADYTLKPDVDQSGTVFTNRGATGTVIFTLPTPGTRCKGWFYKFLGIADFTIRVDTPVADTMITFNDIAADRVSLQTGGQLIGGELELFCDGTSWIARCCSVGHTMTVAT